MFGSIGTLKYWSSHDKLTLEIDPEISRYYRNFIPKYISFIKPGYAPHISVVRKQVPINLSAWGKYEGEQVQFQYLNKIESDERFYWLNCFSTRLEEIRLELGLPLYRSNHRADFRQTFHTTIALKG